MRGTSADRLDRSETGPAHARAVFRPYRPETDLDVCLRIWRAASLEGHPFLSEAELDADQVLVRDIYVPNAQVTVAEIDGSVAGFIALLDDFIGGLFVDPIHHGRGVGRRLVEDAAGRLGSLRVEAYAANQAALRFYRALGFVETGRRELDDQNRPLPLVTMTRA